jgi:hypothetical protein
MNVFYKRGSGFLVATCATDGIGLLLACAVSGNIINARMAAGAGIIAVNG